MLSVLEEDFARIPELLGRTTVVPEPAELESSRSPSPSRARARAGRPARPLLACGGAALQLARGDGGDRGAPRARRSARRRRHGLGRARLRQDDLRPRRLPRARRDGAGDEPDLHDRPPLRGRPGRLAPRPLPLHGRLARRSGATSSRTSTTRSSSSSGRRRRGAGLPPVRAAVRLEHVDEQSRRIADRGRRNLRAMPLILAFDTATDRATSALVGDGEVLGERVSRASTLLDDVDALLRQAGAHPRDLDAARGRHRAGQLHRHPDRPRRCARARARARRPGCGRLDARRARGRRARRDPGDRREAARGLRAGAAGGRARGARARAGHDLRRRRRGSLPRRPRAGGRRGAAGRRRAPPAAGALPRRAGARTSAPSSWSSRSTSACPDAVEASRDERSTCGSSSCAT